MPNWNHMNLLNRPPRIAILAQRAGGGGAEAGVSGFTELLLGDDAEFRSGGRGITISPDGTKAVWHDTTYNAWYGGTMSTPFDPSTITRDTERAEWQANNFGHDISPDGINVISSPSNGLDYGVMSTPWDLSTLGARAYVTGTWSPTTSNQFQGTAFSADGTKIYTGRTNFRVEERTLATPWDTANLDVTSADEVYNWTDNAPADQAFAIGYICFNADGTKLFTCCNQCILMHNLSTAWDLSTAVFSNSIMYTAVAIAGLDFIEDLSGNEFMYVMYSANVYRYGLATDPSPAFDPETLEGRPIDNFLLTEETTYGTADFGTFGIAWKPDGTKFIIHNTGATGEIEEYDCSVAWDVSTAVKGAGTITETMFGAVQSLMFNDDGTRLFEADGNEFGYWDLSSAYDISSAGSYVTHAMTSVTGRGMAFNTDGTKMYEVNTFEDLIEYDLSTPYLPSSKSLVSTTDIIDLINGDSAGPNPDAMWIDPTGQRIYIKGSSRYIFECYMATPWQADTIVYTGRRIRQDDTINGIFFSPDQLKFFTCHSTKQIKTYEYTPIV